MLKYKTLGCYTAHNPSNSLTPGSSRSTKSQCLALPGPLNSIPKGSRLGWGEHFSWSGIILGGLEVQGLGKGPPGILTGGAAK